MKGTRIRGPGETVLGVLSAPRQFVVTRSLSVIVSDPVEAIAKARGAAERRVCAADRRRSRNVEVGGGEVRAGEFAPPSGGGREAVRGRSR